MLKFKKIFLIVNLALFALFVLPISVKAFQETGVGNNLLAEVKPTSPSAGETVTINLSGYGFDLDNSAVRWFVNGKLAKQALGGKTFTFNLGLVGEQTKVEVAVQSDDGQSYSKSFVFDPTEINLFWETPTTKPLWYAGKALPSAGAVIKITALPYLVNQQGQRLSSAGLVYNWKKDDVRLTNLSGVSKNSLNFSTDQNASAVKISVEVKSLTDNISASRDLVIGLVKPEILFYTNEPLAGVNYGQILPKEYSLFDQEMTARAEPYFLPLNGLGFNYLWQIDRAKVASKPGDALSLTLRRGEGVSGSNLINFTAKKGDTSFDNSFIIKYGNGLLKP